MQELNERLLELADFLDLPVVATQDVRYIRPEEELAHLFLSSREPPPVLTPMSFSERTCHHFASANEMRKRFSYKPQALDSTRLIAKRCTFTLAQSRSRSLAHDFERGADADSFLWNLAFEQAVEKFGEITDEIKDRLNHEFDLIKRAGLSDYLRLLWRLVNHLDEQHITRGVGQGHLITSLIAYVLDLTQIDPLENKLLFNQPDPKSDSAPILALEVSSGYLQDILKFIRSEYGERGVCHTGIYQNWEKRNLLQSLCKWARVGDKRTQEIMRAGLPSISRRDSLEDFFRSGKANLSIKNPEILAYLFRQLSNCPRLLQAHEAELLISSEDLDTILPREQLPGGGYVAQLDSEDCKLLGLARLHILTNSSLEILDNCHNWIRRESPHANFDLNRISLDDEPTYRLLAKGWMAGVPAMESPTMKALLRAHKPQNMKALHKVKSMDPSPRPLIKSADDVMADIPNCLLAYRCAYLKAHYPVSFYTAVLDQSRRNPATLRAALHEMRHFNVRLRPVDINHSDNHSSQSGHNIHAGLNVVQWMGEKAANEIQKVRMGGNFESLVDLCRRTDPRLVNNRLILNMAKSGALDCFGLRRSQLLAIADKAIRAARANRLAAIDQADDEPSFFAKTPFQEPELPHDEDFIPDIPEMPMTQLLQYEIDSVGWAMTLSPMAPWSELLKHSHAVCPPALTPRQTGQRICLAGMLEELSFDFPGLDTGDEALASLEDVLTILPPRLTALAKKAIKRQAPVMVSGEAIEKNGVQFLKSHWLFELSYIHQQVKSVNRLIIDLEDENRQTLKALWAVVSRHPGPTRLEVVNYNGRGGGRLLKKIQTKGVLFIPQLFYKLEKILEPDRLRLVDAKNESWPYSYLPRTRPHDAPSEEVADAIAAFEEEN